MFRACSFPGRRDQVSRVREMVAQQLGDSPASDDAVLLASELAANACAHSASGQPGGQFVVRLRGSGSSREQVYVEVEDQGSAWDGLLKQAQSPHGLYLLQACGTRPGASGWITWFVLGPADGAGGWTRAGGGRHRGRDKRIIAVHSGQ